MLIFEREDAQSDAWVWACRKLASRNGGCIGTDMSHSNSRSSHSSGGSSSINSSDVNHQHLLVRNLQPELVQRKIAELEPNLIVIDRRSASRTRDVDALCRWRPWPYSLFVPFLLHLFGLFPFLFLRLSPTILLDQRPPRQRARIYLFLFYLSLGFDLELGSCTSQRSWSISNTFIWSI